MRTRDREPEMRILFATKMVEDRNFQPLGIYYLSAVLKERGHETYSVDATDAATLRRAVERVRPRVLGVSTPTTRYRFFQSACAGIKRERPDLFVVFGGIHATLVPEIVEDEGIDAACRGEGEHAFADLVERIASGRDVGDTPGFWVREGETVHRNAVAPLIEDLDALPFADRAITDEYPYSRGLPVGMFMTGRGCPFHCAF
jgi:anaerobic magnesium-protoporphyrin IX monomethyl ester cyclase